MDPILIDECLSPLLTSVARARGYSAVHATWVDLQNAEDWQIAAIAAERDYVVVTNNRRDFLRLYARLEVHNGLIIIVPRVLRTEQGRLFEIALDVAEARENLMNLVIEVRADGTVDVRNWAKGASD